MGKLCDNSDAEKSKKKQTEITRIIGLLRHIIRALCLTTFTTERLRRFRQLRKRQARCSGTLVVHQMSKVGSSTVVASLSEALPHYAIYHTHFLSLQGLDWLEGFVRERWGSIHIPEHLWHGLFVRDMLHNGEVDERLKIVTLVRDPVARNISEFFQELDVHMSYPYDRKMAELGIDGVVAELENMLLHKLTQEVDWKWPYEWFNAEIKDVLGIDIFAEEFDTSAGYRIFSTGNTDLLLIKLEHLFECCEKAFNEFLGIRVYLANKNVGSQKYYSDAYREILHRLALPVDALEAWYSADQVRHLYSQGEIKGFIDRWSRVCAVKACGTK